VQETEEEVRFPNFISTGPVADSELGMPISFFLESCYPWVDFRRFENWLQICFSWSSLWLDALSPWGRLGRSYLSLLQLLVVSHALRLQLLVVSQARITINVLVCNLCAHSGLAIAYLE
jgi:hypothetical protein